MTNYNAQFFNACRNGSTAVVMEFLDDGVPIDVREQDNLQLYQTALHHAARNGRVETCQALIDRGAEVDARNSRRQTSLHETAQQGTFGPCRLLIQRGADVNALDHRNRSPLYFASTEYQHPYKNQDHGAVFLDLLASGGIYGKSPPLGLDKEVRRMEKLTRLQAAAEMKCLDVLVHVLATDSELATLPERVQKVIGLSDARGRHDAAYLLRSWLASCQARGVIAEMNLAALCATDVKMTLHISN